MADLRTRSIQGALLDARTDRLVNQVLTAGILRGGSDDFKVQQQSTPNMTVRVGSGTAGDIAVVQGTREQGVFLVENREPYYGGGTADVAISNGDPSNPRIDGIDLVVFDDEADSSGDTLATIVVTEGTASAAPTAPAVPSAALRLATVAVAANESTSIGDGVISDMRARASSRTPGAWRWGASLTGGPTSGTTGLVLATINVPALPVATTIDASGFVILDNSAANGEFAFVIRNAGGTSIGQVRNLHTSASQRLSYAIPACIPQTLPADTPTTLTAEVVRVGGSGTATVVLTGRLKVEAVPT